MEYRRRCNVCGKIYCYTDEDLKNNDKNSKMSKISAFGEVVSVFGGTRLDTYVLDNATNRYLDEIVDYQVCPACNSRNTSLLTDADWAQAQERESFHAREVQLPQVSINAGASKESLLTRANMFLREQNWVYAEAYCNHILDMEPTCAQAYVYRLMAERKVSQQSQLAGETESLAESANYQYALQFADDALRKELESYERQVADNMQESRYAYAISLYQDDRTIKGLNDASCVFSELGNYKDSANLAQQCKLLIKDVENEPIYQKAVERIQSDEIERIERGIQELEGIKDWRDSAAKIEEGKARIKMLKKEKEEQGHRTKRIAIVAGIVIAACIAILPFVRMMLETNNYKKALNDLNAGNVNAALDDFKKAGNYADAEINYETLTWYFDFTKNWNDRQLHGFYGMKSKEYYASCAAYPLLESTGTWEKLQKLQGKWEAETGFGTRFYEFEDGYWFHKSPGKRNGDTEILDTGVMVYRDGRLYLRWYENEYTAIKEITADSITVNVVDSRPMMNIDNNTVYKKIS